MKLVLTYYVDSNPSEVESELVRAASRGLDSAAELMSDTRDETRTETIKDGIRIVAGLNALNGSEIHVSGVDRLTTVKVSVPWSNADAGTSKLWAATRFATVVTDQVGIAA